MIARHLACLGDFGDYMTEINHNYSNEQLTELLTTLYKGYGVLPKDEITEKYGLKLPLELNRRHMLNGMLQEEQNERNALKIVSRQGERSNEMVMTLDKSDFTSFIHRSRNQWFLDTNL